MGFIICAKEFLQITFQLDNTAIILYFDSIILKYVYV